MNDDPIPSDRPTCFALLGCAGDRVLQIRDFRYASYVLSKAEYIGLDGACAATGARRARGREPLF